MDSPQRYLRITRALPGSTYYVPSGRKACCNGQSRGTSATIKRFTFSLSRVLSACFTRIDRLSAWRNLSLFLHFNIVFLFRILSSDRQWRDHHRRTKSGWNIQRQSQTSGVIAHGMLVFHACIEKHFFTISFLTWAALIQHLWCRCLLRECPASPEVRHDRRAFVDHSLGQTRGKIRLFTTLSKILPALAP